MAIMRLTQCPLCGSKKLKTSEYIAQIWLDRSLRRGKLSNPKTTKCPTGEIIATLSCARCDFLVNEEWFDITDNGYILLDDEYLERIERQEERQEDIRKQNEESRKAIEKLMRMGMYPQGDE